jgi:hypothetical protein
MKDTAWYLRLVAGVLLALTQAFASESVLAQGPSDGLGDRITETGPSWTGQWTRRAGTNVWDATYEGGSGQPTTMTVTRTGSIVTAVRTFSGDGNLCTYRGTLAADGATITGQGTCPTGYTFPFTLRLATPSLAPPTVTPRALIPTQVPSPPPPAAPQGLGPVDPQAYCQSLEYTVDLGDLVLTIAPYDGAVAEGGSVYCAALNVWESGLDVYSEPLDLNQACAWQYGAPTMVAPSESDPLRGTCLRP